jgi:pimeloyl-ACP methyl ester carboxylesterase
MKKLIIALFVICILVLVYVLGPRFDKPVLNDNLPAIHLNVQNVENYVDSIESVKKLKPDNQARIIWNNDSIRNKTEYVVLYLPGYGASWFEGYPTNINFAKTIGANIYLSRLASHGIDTSEPLIDMYPAALYESVKQALVIAHSLGNKVIVMSTSTGGTLALKLAADFPDMVHSLILLSPNIAINNPAAFLLPGHWGLQVARLSGGGGLCRIEYPGSETEQKYWYKKQRWESVIYLQQLINAAMTKDVFSKVKQPVLLGYYYKNEKEQDPVVKVSAMLKMFDQLGTPDSLKVKVAFPEAGNHVIGCSLLSKSYLDVEREVLKFARKIGIQDNFLK